MKMQIVAIKDRALDAFMRPFFAQTLDQAKRMFRDEINRPNSEAGAHPEDYDLYHLGDFEDHNGKINQLEQPKQLAIGMQQRNQGHLDLRVYEQDELAREHKLPR